MKNIVKIFCSLIIIILLREVSYGQINDCGVELDDEYLDSYKKMVIESRKQAQSDSNAIYPQGTDITYHVSIKLHMLRRDDGSGASVSKSFMIEQINTVNSRYFNKLNINFILDPDVNYINDSDAYDKSLIEQIGDDFFKMHQDSNIINVYVFKKVFSGGKFVGGYAHLPYGNPFLHRVVLSRT